jgi:hypothetical protein
LAGDPVGSTQEPPVLRSSAGVFQDIRIGRGQAILQPGEKNPMLLVVAEWEADGGRTVVRRLSAPAGPVHRATPVAPFDRPQPDAGCNERKGFDPSRPLP